MVKKKKGEHVVMFGTNFHCQHCGAEEPIDILNGREAGFASGIMQAFVKRHRNCPKSDYKKPELKRENLPADAPFDERFTGKYDIHNRQIMDGDIVFWDDGSMGKWSRIARVYWKKPVLVFKVIASPYSGIIGAEFNFGNFIYQDTENHLEIMATVGDGLEKAAKLRGE